MTKIIGSYRLGSIAFVKLALILAMVTATSACQIKSAAATPPGACTGKIGKIVNALLPSTIYKVPVAVSVYLPPCYEALKTSIPVVYLLHGANANETQWPDLRIQLSADTAISETHQPFIVVMPGGNYLFNLNYSAFVLDDLLPTIEKTYKVRAMRCSRAIGGLSLGGYWALQVAFQHPDLFVAAGGHSPVVVGTGTDAPLDLARAAKGLKRLKITLDVGKSDGLKSGTVRLADMLVARAISVTLSLNPGRHDRPYWRAHSEEYLRFYAKSFVPPACTSNR